MLLIGEGNFPTFCPILPTQEVHCNFSTKSKWDNHGQIWDMPYIERRGGLVHSGFCIQVEPHVVAFQTLDSLPPAIKPLFRAFLER
jgi:hypothetical protein